MTEENTTKHDLTCHHNTEDFILLSVVEAQPAIISAPILPVSAHSSDFGKGIRNLL